MMKKKKVDIFKKYTPRELVESFVFRTTLTDKEKEESFAALRALRKKAKAEMSEGFRMEMNLGGLKYQMEDSVKEKTYDPSKSFGAYLRKYAKIIKRKNKELANDLDIDETRFSQIINGRILPGEKIVYKLEYHCDNIIPAKVWLEVLQKDVEYKVESDLETRKVEYESVKNRISFSNKSIFISNKKSDVALRVKQMAEKVAVIRFESGYSIKGSREFMAKEPKRGYGVRKAVVKKKK